MTDDLERLQALESILFLAAEPVAEESLSLALEVGTTDVRDLLGELGERLLDRQSGLVLRNVAGGWRLYAGDGGRAYVERYVLAGRSGRLSQAALETLAVVAYKQPISRSEIGDIRGVNADGAVRSLVARGLVEEVGRDDGPGQAVLYGTTIEFLEKVGLDALDDLPELAGYLADDAPDEPAPSMLKQARRRLQEGGDLPATGASRWAPDGEEAGDEPAGADDDAAEPQHDDQDPDTVAAAEAERRRDEVRRRREQEDEMESLTGALERATKSAMAQLRSAVAAQEDDESEDAEGDPEGADADTTTDGEVPDE